MKKKVVIFGTGGFAKIVYLYLKQANPSHLEVVAFTANERVIKDRAINGLPVIPFEVIEKKYPSKENHMFIAVGYSELNRKRARFFEEAKDKGYSMINYIHPSTIVNEEFEIGENCFIFENNVIQPYVKLEDDVIIWTGNVISHHTTIMKHCFIVSHTAIAGNTVIEPFCFIGMNATIRNGIRIATECVIGAGSVILDNTNEKEVYAAHSTIKLDITSNQLKNL